MNTRTERTSETGACKEERETEEEERFAREEPFFLFACHALFFLDLPTSALDDGRRFESAISRWTRKLCRLDHS